LLEWAIAIVTTAASLSVTVLGYGHSREAAVLGGPISIKIHAGADG
jgi:hypothetical protein